MPKFDHALIVTIEADDYAQSQKIATWIAAGVGDSEQLSCVAGHFWGEETDNSGQRVIYLHPEGTTADWDIDDDPDDHPTDDEITSYKHDQGE